MLAIATAEMTLRSIRAPLKSIPSTEVYTAGSGGRRGRLSGGTLEAVAALAVCAEAGCGAVAVKRGRCAKHQLPRRGGSTRRWHKRSRARTRRRTLLDMRRTARRLRRPRRPCPSRWS
jgi:hypothetical protein